MEFSFGRGDVFLLKDFVCDAHSIVALVTFGLDTKSDER
jgi:hypothetical protein